MFTCLDKKSRKGLVRRAISAALMLVLCASLVPAPAFARDVDGEEVVSADSAPVEMVAGATAAAREDVAVDDGPEEPDGRATSDGAAVSSGVAKAAAVSEGPVKAGEPEEQGVAGALAESAAPEEPAPAGSVSAEEPTISENLASVGYAAEAKPVSSSATAARDREAVLGETPVVEASSGGVRAAKPAAKPARALDGTMVSTLQGLSSDEEGPELQALSDELMARALMRDKALAALESSYDYSGDAYCWFRNDSATDDVFSVEIDGETYEAYCIDPGLPAPANGWYTFYATWDDGEKAYDIVLDTTDADVHWSQVDLGTGCQRVGGFRIYAKGGLQLTKTSSNLEVSGAYSVAGAEYGLCWYRVDAEAMAEPDYRLVIGDAGVSDVISGLTPDERWYVRELVAPLGFQLDPTVHTVSIRPHEQTTYAVVDSPVMDPNGVLLKKVTASGEEFLGEHLSLALAEYQFDYYAGYYDSVAEAEASGAPTRTWVMRTDVDGFTGTLFADDSFIARDKSYGYLVTGTVYRDSWGNPSMPLGTLVIHEIKPPAGYKLSETYFLAKLISADNEMGFAWDADGNFFDGNTALDEEKVDAGSLTILKVSSHPEVTSGTPAYSLAGAQFGIYDNATCQGKPIYTLTTREDGTTDTLSNLPPGSHWFIKELAAPRGFLLSDEIYEAIIEPGSVAVTTVRITDDFESGSLILSKKSADPALTDGNPQYSLAGAIFDVYDNASCLGSPTYTLTTSENGTAGPLRGLPLGSVWWVKKRVSPAGYELSTEVSPVTIASAERITVTVAEKPLSGSFFIKKTSAYPMLTEGNALYSLEGAVFGVWPDESCMGTPTYQLTTKADGTTDSIEGLALGSQWYVKEIMAPSGYQIASTVQQIRIVDTRKTCVSISDAPVYAPANVSLVKRDSASYAFSLVRNPQAMPVVR